MSRFPWLLAFIATVPVAVPAVHAGARTEKLDCVANPRLLDTHFARYGHAPLKTIAREPQGIRLRLPADPKGGVGQTGIYSYIALVGDFEIVAAYEWINVPAPKAGYGVSAGLAVEATSPAGTVALARAHLPGKGDGYIVTRGRPSEKGVQYDTTHFPTKATVGRLVLRREQKEMVCLAADGSKAPPSELCRVPFTDATVRQTRFFADPGGSPTTVDVRLGQIRIEAEKIVGGAPLREDSGRLGWWIAGGAVILGCIAGAAFLWRRRQRC